MIRTSTWAAIAALALASLATPALAQRPMSNPEAAPDENPEARLAAAVDRLTYRPEPSVVAATQAQLAQAPGVAAAQKARADALRSEAASEMAAGRTGAGLRKLYEAMAATRGSDWAIEAHPSSLVLEANPILDPGQPLFATIKGAWPEPTPDGTTVRLRLVDGAGGVVRDFGVQPLGVKDLVAQPQRYALSLKGLPSGAYRLAAELAVNGRVVGVVRTPVAAVDGFYAAEAEIEAALAAVSGHETAKATIRYPFSLARELATGQREVLKYDFPASVARSRELAAALKAGRDPVERAVGDMKRAYYFADAGTNVPYRLYVPTKWNGHDALPMVVFLHGANLDDDDSMERANGLLPRLAEERGLIVLAPLGYRMNSGYGAFRPAAGPGGFGGGIGSDPRRAALSEQDVLNVTDLVAKEYGVDTRRVYLAGNSMGGAGTWHIARKYPSRWAAIGPAAFGANDPAFDFTPLRKMPIIAVAGEFDFARPRVEETVAAAKAAGLRPTYVMVPRGTHGTGIEIAMPQVLDFFARHARPK